VRVGASSLEAPDSHIIIAVRDLGTSLGFVRILWMARCGLCDLDGVAALRSLQELYVAYNRIRDLSALSLVDTLEVVDLEGHVAHCSHTCCVSRTRA
jgi:Leucine-rich repeat (LRR) protein